MGEGVQFNFTITFDQYVLYSYTEALTQPYLETTGNPTLEHFQENYVFDSGRTISIHVSCNENSLNLISTGIQRARAMHGDY